MQDTYETIYKKYFSKVYLYILTISKNEHIAEEITQETFFKALQKIENFNGDCKIYTWLCKIAKNTLYDFYKKEKKKVSIDENFDNLTCDLDFIAEFDKKEESIEIHSLLHKLEEPYKEVFTLRVFAELSFKQIGEIFEKSDGWARVIFYRAKNKLMEGYDENFL